MSKKLLFLCFLVMGMSVFARPFSASATTFMLNEYDQNDYMGCVTEDVCYWGSYYTFDGWNTTNHLGIYSGVAGAYVMGNGNILIANLTQPPFPDKGSLDVIEYTPGGVFVKNTDVWNFDAYTYVNYSNSYITNDDWVITFAGRVLPDTYYRHIFHFVIGESDIANINSYLFLPIAHNNYYNQYAVGVFDDRTFYVTHNGTDVEIYLSDIAKTELNLIGSTTLAGTLDSTLTKGTFAFGGSETRATVLYGLDNSSIYRIDVVKNINTPTGYLGQNAVTQFASGWEGFDCTYFEDNPLCVIYDSSYPTWHIYRLLTTNYGWDQYIYLNNSLIVDGKNYITNMRGTMYNTYVNTLGTHDGIKIDMSEATVYAKVLLFGYQSDGTFSSIDNFKCNNINGQICLVDSTGYTYSIPSYNLNNCDDWYCASEIPTGVYSVGFYDSVGHYIECNAQFLVTMDGSEYSLYVDSDNCLQSGTSTGYQIQAYGTYGVLNYNLSSQVSPFAVKNMGTGLNELFDCTFAINGSNTLNSSTKFNAGIERSDGKDYTSRFLFEGNESEGLYYGILDCEISNTIYELFKVYNVSGADPGKITVLQNDVNYLKTNLIKVRFHDGVNTDVNLNNGVCELTIYGDSWTSVYPMYVTNTSYCSKINNLIGGNDCIGCQADGTGCYYYAIIDLKNIYSYLNNTYNISITCTDANYTNTTSDLNVTYESPTIHYSTVYTIDAKNNIVTTLYYNNRTSEDQFKFLGYVLESYDNATIVYPDGIECTLEYEICQTLDGVTYNKVWKETPITFGSTTYGIGYSSDWLLTYELCNGRNLTTSSGVPMPNSGRVLFECSAPGYTILKYDGSYTADSNTALRDVGLLYGFEPSVVTGFRGIITGGLNVGFFIGNIVTQTMLSHMLESIVLVILIILAMPLIARSWGFTGTSE